MYIHQKLTFLNTSNSFLCQYIWLTQFLSFSHLYLLNYYPFISSGKESACNAGDLGLIPGLGRSPGEGNGYPFQCSGLENFMNCMVHGVAKVGHDQASFTFTFINIWGKGLHCCLSGKESTCQCRRHTFSPSSGKIPHAAEQRNPSTTTIERVLWGPEATTTEAHVRACALQ